MAFFQTSLNPGPVQSFVGKLKNKIATSVGSAISGLNKPMNVPGTAQNSDMNAGVKTLAGQVLPGAISKASAVSNPIGTLISSTASKVGGAIGGAARDKIDQVMAQPITGVPGTAQRPPVVNQQGTPPPTDAQLAAVRAVQNPVKAPISPTIASKTPVSSVASTATTTQPRATERTTLIGPNGERVDVPTGSKVAEGYMKQGYKAENSTPVTTAAIPAGTNEVPVVSQPENQPAAPSTLEQQREALRQSLLGATTLSPQEQKAQEELARLNEEANAAIYGVDAEGSQRGFTTGYATGLKGAFAKQADIAKLPLEARIANMQSAREAQQKADATKLGFIQSDIEAERAAQKDSARLSREDAATKRTILLQALQGGATQQQMAAILAAKTPEEAIQIAGALLNPKQKSDFITVGEGQSVIDPVTGKTVFTNPKSSGVDTLNPLQQAQLDKLNAENQTAANAKTAGGAQVQATISTINDLINSDGLNAAVGLKGPSNYFPGTNAANFKAKLEQLKSQLTLSVLPQLKGTGAISDAEQAILQNSVAALNTNMSESAFKDELGRIKTMLEGKQGGTPQQQGNYQQKYAEYQQRYPNAAPGEIEGLLKEAGVFNNASTTALNGSAQQIAAAIKQVESGGNYNARGASTEGGAYQFMPATWKELAGKYLGNPSAPMTPQNQDFVAQSKIQELLNQGYNAQEVALIWNGGQPIVKKGVNQYGVPYDSGAYANKVLSQLA